nr:hypothetical protein [Tanacetum cinerariifolium]
IDDIDFVEAAPPHYELVSLGKVKDFHPEDGEIEDDILHEKLSKINLLIAKIESLNDNPLLIVCSREPRVHVPNVLPTHPTLVLDSDFIPSDNSLPESKIFCFDIEEKNSGSTTIHADISLLDFDH